jgi:hypothetical protein
MLWLTSLIPLVTKETVPLTIIGIRAMARIIMTIRQIQGFICTSEFLPLFFQEPEQPPNKYEPDD